MNPFTPRAKRDRRGEARQFSLEYPQRGFTLLEVLLAITLLAVGVLALARMQTRAVQSNSFGNQLTEATILAQDQAENLRLLNERFLANPAGGEPAALQDTVANWTIDTNSDGDVDNFDWAGPEVSEGPIDARGNAVATGIYTREWCVEDDVPVIRAKTIHVRVRWANNRQVKLETVLSQ